MQTMTTRQGSDKANFGLALLLAVILHMLFLALPKSGPAPGVTHPQASFRLHLTTLPQTAPETMDEKRPPGAGTAAPRAMPRTTKGSESKTAPVQTRSLARQLLSRQYLSERPVRDPLSAAGPHPQTHAPERSFHYPRRIDMLTMLDRPLPDLPFEYTSGLVRFAYDPGVRGDMQRFWDKITPEFGWTTRYGTEVRCVWVLAVMACGWK